MLLVKKYQFSLFLVLVKTRQELRFHNVLERKETFLSIKTKFFKVPKMVFLQRGSPMLLAKKYQFFLCLFLVKTRLEIRFNYVLDTKQPLFDYKMKISESPKNRIFPKRLTHGFGQYLYLVLVKTTLEIRFNNVVDRKETFFEYKNKIFQSPKNHNFPKGFTHAIDQKMPVFSLFVFGQNKTRNEV